MLVRSSTIRGDRVSSGLTLWDFAALGLTHTRAVRTQGRRVVNHGFQKFSENYWCVRIAATSILVPSSPLLDVQFGWVVNRYGSTPHANVLASQRISLKSHQKGTLV